MRAPAPDNIAVPQTVPFRAQHPLGAVVNRPQTVIHRLGKPAPTSESDKVVPFRAPEDLANPLPGGRYDVQAPDARVLRYDDTLYLVCPQPSPRPGGVSHDLVTGAGAVTSTRAARTLIVSTT